MYRLKPRVTYPRFALITGAVAVALAGPNLLAARIQELPPAPVIIGQPHTPEAIDLGMRCDMIDQGLFRDYDCGDTIIESIATDKANDVDVAVERMMRAFNQEAEGKPVWRKGVLVQKVEGGWAAFSFRPDQLWVVITSGAQDQKYLSHAINLMGEDLPDGVPGADAPHTEGA